MGGRAQSKTFANFDRSAQPEAYRAARSFLEKRETLVLCGPNGVGKTHLAYSIGNAILEKHGSANAPVLFITFDDALRQLRETYRDGYEGQGEWFYLERWITIPVLLLDEAGQAGRRGPTGDGEFTRRIGYDIVDGRYRKGLPMVLTTNKTPNQLAEWITRSAVDRLSEAGRFIEMEGKSWRLHHRQG